MIMNDFSDGLSQEPDMLFALSKLSTQSVSPAATPIPVRTTFDAAVF